VDGSDTAMLKEIRPASFLSLCVAERFIAISY
jgi:hypothetical protein